MYSAEIRHLLRRVRHRYRRLRVQDRPPLDQPQNVAALLPGEDMATLARAGLWPLPARVRRWLAAGPSPGPAETFRQAWRRLVADHPHEVRSLLSALLWPQKRSIVSGKT